ncbi:unnamed protein product, partial [marine sediment metagenome]
IQYRIDLAEKVKQLKQHVTEHTLFHLIYKIQEYIIANIGYFTINFVFKPLL